MNRATGSLLVPNLIDAGLKNLFANTVNAHAKKISFHDAGLLAQPFVERIAQLESEIERLKEFRASTRSDAFAMIEMQRDNAFEMLTKVTELRDEIDKHNPKKESNLSYALAEIVDKLNGILTPNPQDGGSA